MRVRTLCVGLLGGWLSMPALAVDNAYDWLRRLADAQRSTSYVGDFVYQRNGAFSTHSIWQRVEDGATTERVLQLDGPAVEVVRVDGRLVCATDAPAASAQSAKTWRDKRLDPEDLSKWYELRVIGDSRVAGRDSVALAILPRDQHRYGFELHVDRETGLPLKSLMLDEHGQLLERFQYTRLKPGQVAASELKASDDCLRVTEASAEQKEATGWYSDWLPDGFRLLQSSSRTSDVSGQPVTWLVYGDGLARFSVFIEPLGGEVVQDARSQMGPTVAVSKRITAPGGDVMVTVVGEIPLGTAERIALSMRPEQDAQN